MEVWVKSEVSECKFPDKRLSDRLVTLLSSLGEKIGDTIPTACRDWAATKAAYRFFSNPRICLLYTSPSPRDQRGSRMPSSA